jgi:hypothetical protein
MSATCLLGFGDFLLNFHNHFSAIIARSGFGDPAHAFCNKSSDRLEIAVNNKLAGRFQGLFSVTSRNLKANMSLHVPQLKWCHYF